MAELWAGERGGGERARPPAALGLADLQTSADWPAAVQHSDGRSIDDELNLIAEAVKKKPCVHAPPAEASATLVAVDERVRVENEVCLAMPDETECGSTKGGATPPLEDEATEEKRRERAAAAVALRENFGTMLERALPVGALATSVARTCLYTAPS